MYSPEKNQTLPSSTTTKKPRRRCIAISALALMTIIIAVITLAFTVFKVREPTMRINSVHFDNLDLTKNLTVVGDASVNNPNALPFKFNSSTTSLFYRKKEVAVADGPPGAVGAHRTLRMNVTMNVNPSVLSGDSNFMADVAKGSVELETSTTVGGKVTILGMFKRHVDLMMNCSVSLEILSQKILYQHCMTKMRL